MSKDYLGPYYVIFLSITSSFIGQDILLKNFLLRHFPSTVKLLFTCANFISSVLSCELWYVIVRRDRLCGLVVRVSGYRYRSLGFDSRRYQIF